MINTALTLGYNVETGTKYGGSAMDEYIATQILIWLIAHGQLGTGYENQIVNEITANSPAAKTIFQKLRKTWLLITPFHPLPPTIPVRSAHIHMTSNTMRTLEK